MATPARKPIKPFTPATILAALVDEIGDLTQALAPFKGKITRLDDAKRDLRGKHASSPADQMIIVHGQRWSIILGTKPADAAIAAHTRAGSRNIMVVNKAA